jgi:hypothetical protein
MPGRPSLGTVLFDVLTSCSVAVLRFRMKDMKIGIIGKPKGSGPSVLARATDQAAPRQRPHRGRIHSTNFLFSVMTRATPPRGRWVRQSMRLGSVASFAHLTSRRPQAGPKVRLLFSLRRERLVREGRSRRPLYHNEAAVRSLVAAVAGGGEFVVSGRKLGAVARLNGAFDLLDPRHDQVIHHLADRNALVIGDELAGLPVEVCGMSALPTATRARPPSQSQSEVLP